MELGLGKFALVAWLLTAALLPPLYGAYKLAEWYYGPEPAKVAGGT